MGVGGQRHVPAALPLGNSPGFHCTGAGGGGPRAGVDGCGKSRPTGLHFVIHITTLSFKGITVNVNFVLRS
jgi:hypothetical protein